MSTSTSSSVRSEKRQLPYPSAGILDTMVMAHPDETCPGVWVQLDLGVGYCELGDGCRNPLPEAHADWIDETGDRDPEHE